MINQTPDEFSGPSTKNNSEGDDEQRALQALYKASLSLLSALNLEKLLGVMVHEIIELTKTSQSAVYLVDENKKLTARAGKEALEQLVIPIPETELSNLFDMGLLKQHHRIFEASPDAKNKQIMQSVVVQPLTTRHPLGILVLFSTDPQHFSRHYLKLIQKFAQQAALALQNALRYEERIEENQKSKTELETALAEREWSNLLLEKNPEALIAVENHGQIVFANEKFQEIFGYNLDEILHQPVEVLMPTNLAQTHEKNRFHYYADPESKVMGNGQQIYAQKKDKSVFPVEIKLVPIKVNGAHLTIAQISNTPRDINIDTALRELSDYTDGPSQVDHDFLREQSPETSIQAAMANLKSLLGCEVVMVLSIERKQSGTITISVTEPEDIFNDISDQRDKLKRCQEFLIGDIMHGGEYHVIPDLPSLKESQSTIIQHLLDIGVHSYTALPLRIKGDLSGLLVIGIKTPGALLRQQLGMAQQIATQIAMLIHNTQLNLDAQKRLRVLTLLSNTSHILSSSLEMDLLLPAMAQQIVATTNTDGFVLAQWDQTKDALVTLLDYSTEPDIPNDEPGTIYNLAEYPVSQQVLTQRIPMVISIEDSSMDIAEVALLRRYYGMLMVPLIARDQVIGLLALFTKQERIYHQTEVDAYQILANQVAVAVENASLYGEVQRYAEELEQRVDERTARLRQLYRRQSALAKIDLAISQLHEFKDLLQGIPEIINNLLPASSGAGIYIWDPDTKPFSNAAFTSFLPEEEKHLVQIFLSESDAFEWIYQRQTPIVVEDTSTDRFMVGKELKSRNIWSYVGFPILGDDGPIGIVVAMDNRPRRYNAEDLAFMSTLSRRTAIAITKVHLFEATRQSAAQLSVVRDILNTLNAAQDVLDVFQEIAANLQKLTQCDRVSLAILENDKKNLIISALDKNTKLIGKGFKSPVTHTSAFESINQDRIHLTPDLSAEIEYPAERTLFDAGFRSRINLPLFTPEGAIGALNIAWKTTNGYKPDQVSALSQIADAIALSLQKTWSFQQMQAALADTQMLYQIARTVTSVDQIENLLQNAVDQVAASLPAQQVTLVSLDIENKKVEHYYCGGPAAKKDLNPIFDDLWRDFSSSMHTNLNQSSTGLVIAESQLDIKAQAAGKLVVPLTYKNNFLGMLTTEGNPTQRAYSQREFDLLTTVASQLAAAIENYRLFSEVQQLAKIDALTGIYNRRFLFELGQREIERAHRYNHDLSAIMFDIDHFKKINDTYGHKVGDEVLRTLARTCKKTLRTSDIIGRYGGEEFAIILPNANFSTTFQVAERLRLLVEKKPVQTSKGNITITISLGLATLSKNVLDMASLLDRADTALYEAKQAGRNQTRPTLLP